MFNQIADIFFSFYQRKCRLYLFIDILLTRVQPLASHARFLFFSFYGIFLEKYSKIFLFFSSRCCVVDTLEWQWMLKLYNILRRRNFFSLFKFFNYNNKNKPDIDILINSIIHTWYTIVKSGNGTSSRNRMLMLPFISRTVSKDLYIVTR